MTFKHKLSARLALLKDRGVAVSLTLLAAAVVFACQLPARLTDTGSGTVTQVVVYPKSMTVRTGRTADFMAVALTSAGDTATAPVTWSATSGSITDTSTSGGRHYLRYQAGPDTGKVKVIARSQSVALSDTATVAVTLPPVAAVSISPASASLLTTQTLQLTATTLDSTGTVLIGRTVTWSSGSTGVATVSSNGLVTGVAVGSATITARSEGQSGSSSITVTTVPVASVTVSPASGSLYVGQTVQLTATPKDSAGNPLTGRVIAWSSDNTTVATVGAAGLVTGKGAGSATITATTAGKSGTSAISVANVTIASVTVSPASTSLFVGQTVQLTATPKDSAGNPLTGQTITWSSDNIPVATVSASGLVTGTTAGTATIRAATGGKSGTSSIAVAIVPIASVAVSPASATVQTGSTVPLAATPKDSAGNALTGRTVSWASSNLTVATVNSSGLVSGVALGTATITATSGGKSGSSAITVVAPPPPGTHAGWYASPTGTSSGNGSSSAPWDLATALRGGNGKVQPGDTVWLRGGTYPGNIHSYLTGTAAAPIVVRQYPGERAIIDGGGSTAGDNFVAAGDYSIFWGFEVTNNNPSRCCSTSSFFRGDGVVAFASHVKFINLTVHDAGSGIYVWSKFTDVEIVGCVVYNNGWQGSDRGHGHAMYVKSDAGPVLLHDNIIFNNYGYGVHIYTDAGDGLLNNIHVDGNVVFNAGVLSNNTASPDILAGGGQVAANDIAVVNNMTYYSPGYSARGLVVGPVGSSLLNGAMTVQNNYIVGGSLPLYVGNWQTATVAGNTLYGTGTMQQVDDPNVVGHQWAGNMYYHNPTATAWSYAGTSYTFAGWQAQSGLGLTDQATATPPSATKVFVRPSVYEPGRANIIVYNWGQLGAVAVDVSSVLRVGDRYEIRNAQDLFGTPVVSGMYGGGTISLPMTGVTPPTPVGLASSPAPVTGPNFDVFVVTSPR